MTTTLHQLIYGKSSETGEFTTLGASDGVNPDDGHVYYQQVPLEPLPIPDATLSQSVAVIALDNSHNIFARAHNLNGDVDNPIYQYIFLTPENLNGLAGNLHPLLNLVADPLTDISKIPAPLSPLELASPETWTFDKQIALLKKLLQNLPNKDTIFLLSILGAARDKRRLLIRNFPAITSERLLLAQGLMMLLPDAARPLLTFTTNTTDLRVLEPRIIFTDDPVETERWVIDWSQELQPIEDVLQLPYIKWLSNIWKNNVKELVDGIKSMDMYASKLMAGHTIETGLIELVERYQLDRRIEKGDRVPVDKLMAVLTSPAPPHGALRTHYIEQVLHVALTERNPEATRLVAQEMDKDIELEAALEPAFAEALQTQPDDVYAFIRARLSDGVTEKWLSRLKAAATVSVDIAVLEGDTETVAGWIKLISREPTIYGLNEILQTAIVSAEQRAHEDGDLGRELIVQAIKRDPAILDRLLADSKLTAQIPEVVRRALCDLMPDAVTALAAGWREIPQGRELFLAAVSRTLQAGREISPMTLQALWAIYTDETPFTISDIYRPEIILIQVVSKIDRLSVQTQEILLIQMLSDQQDDLFVEAIAHLVGHESLFALLATVFERSNRSVRDILDISGRLTNHEYIAPQQVVNIYVTLLVEWDWHTDTQAMVEQVARLLNKNTSLTVSTSVLWKILEMAADTKMEMAARVAIRRLVEHFQGLDFEGTGSSQFVDDLLHLHHQSQWNLNVKATLLNAVREFARELPINQLQRLEKAIENKRVLEEIRSVVQTTLGLRKVIGQRSLQELATAINDAYATLEVIANAFDPSSGKQILIDPQTLQTELDERQDELAPDERHVLAKNLKELAKLIATLSENRSKPSLIRGDDALERQLATGEQPPESALDLMKWFSGYLEGVQTNEEGAE